MKHRLLILSIAAFLILVVMACGFPFPFTSGYEINLIHTSAAKTFAVEHPISTPQPNGTITPTPSSTAKGTSIPLPTETPLPTLTRTPLTIPDCIYDSEVTDASLEDKSTIQTGEKFEMTWEFYNSGTCRWNNDVSLVFIQGRRMGGKTVYLDDYVRSGEYIEVTVDLTAPLSIGEYIGYWQLLDPNGELFGEKSQVDILAIIKPTATPTRTMTRTVTPTRTMTRTATPSPSATRTLTPTLTSTYTITPSLTSTNTPTETSSPTSSFTPLPTDTFTPVPTETPTITPSPT